MVSPRELRSSERGAVLVHVAIALLGLVAFSAFSVDYGVLWTARRQAQNAADAGAMAGAVSMAFVALNDQDLARQSALTFATRNAIWGTPPDVTPGDVTFPNPCPSGPFPPGGNCIRVDVFRNQRAGGNPLPTFFGNLAGVTEQGVRATATARVLFGGQARCLLPFAIPDKWLERHPEAEPWTDDETFDITEGRPPAPVPTPDVYTPPTADDPGTGFTRASLDGETGGDYGLQMTLRMDDPRLSRDKAAAGWYRPIRLGEDDSGLPDLLANILDCSTTPIGFGDVLTTEPGRMASEQINDAIQEVVSRDLGARWDPTANDGRGGVVGGCMEAGTCELSPRIRPVPVYDPLAWEHRSGLGGGQFPLEITKVIGVFLEGVNADGEIVGRVMTYPATAWDGENEVTETATFLVTITLVR